MHTACHKGRYPSKQEETCAGSEVGVVSRVLCLVPCSAVEHNPVVFVPNSLKPQTLNPKKGTKVLPDPRN